MKRKLRARQIDPATPNGASELEAWVQSQLGRQICTFSLLMRANGLILRGRARSYYAKQLAQHAIMDVTSLPILANEIEVA